MPAIRRFRACLSPLLWPIALSCLVLGCGKAEPPLPATLPELSVFADQARDEARAARDARDPARAQAAAKRALRASQAAQALAPANAPLPADRTGIDHAAAEARTLAELAGEDADLAARTGGLKAKAWRGTRQVAVLGAFKALALAAGQAAARPRTELAPGVAEAADAAAEVACALSGRPRPSADAPPDWTAVAAELDGWAKQPPGTLATFLAASFVLLGRSDLALCEVQEVSPDSFGPVLADPGQRRFAAAFLRAFVYSFAGLPRRGEAELNALIDFPIVAGGADLLLAGAHLFFAVQFARLGEWQRADAELVRAIRAWPNNPVAVYLTGEQQAANGEFERAAESLEQAARGTDHEWLAGRIAARARDVRDRRTDRPALFTDDGFMLEVVLHLLGQAASKSEAGRAVREWVDAARAFGRRVTGGSEEEAGAADAGK